MQLTPEQTKRIGIALIIVIVVMAVLFLVRLVGPYLGTRAPLPGLSETIVGGRLKAEVIKPGDHVLEFRAKTTDGKIVTTQVKFNASDDPYAPGDYDPYGQPSTPTPTPGDPYKL